MQIYALFRNTALSMFLTGAAAFLNLGLMSAGAWAADPAAFPNSANSNSNANTGGESLTVKQHIIKWMLSDEKFVEKAATSSRAEIELSQLAIDKSQSSAVVGFAKTMIQDHSAANSKLSVIAEDAKLPLPAQLDSESQENVERLKNLSAAQFDAAYIDVMKKDHEKAVSLFAAAADDKKLNPNIQKFAQQTLPTLRMHEKHVQSLMSENSAASH